MAIPFYELRLLTETDEGFQADVSLNPDHPVYQGHFPNQPVAPGVLLMDMCRTVAETALSREVRIGSARSIKFVKVVDPTKLQELTLTMKFVESEDSVRFQCVATSGEDTYFKIIANI
ncbi:MAG: 3-hydroxyacyl-[acyl-carrier-protein] dehydratase [Granulosicoccus sp.]|jgi:3-hydroxyacyl-[acyl-carrier-protein] dehydratase